MPQPGRTADEEGRTLVERLGGRWGPGGGLCRCPAHDDRTPSLSVRPGRTRLLLHCFAGCTAAEILRALQSGRLIDPAAAPVNDLRLAKDECPVSAAACRIWAGGRSIAGTAAELYLAGRGLRTCSPELRFHPRTPHGRQPLTRYRPALIAAVRDSSRLTGIHRTFLDSGPRGSPRPLREKLGLGRFGTGAVRLGESGSILGLAEGIETALAATELFGISCWATLGAERFASVELPSATRELLLFLDHDSGGRRAETLAREAFGRDLPIRAHYPRWPGDDWNDVLRASLARPIDRERRGEEAAGG